jgi:hypothetical protein
LFGSLGQVYLDAGVIKVDWHLVNSLLEIKSWDEARSLRRIWQSLEIAENLFISRFAGSEYLFLLY